MGYSYIISWDRDGALDEWKCHSDYGSRGKHIKPSGFLQHSKFQNHGPSAGEILMGVTEILRNPSLESSENIKLKIVIQSNVL